MEETVPPSVEINKEEYHRGIALWKSTFNKRQWYGLKNKPDRKIQIKRMEKKLPNIQLPARYGTLRDWIEWDKNEDNDPLVPDIYLANDLSPLTKEEVEENRNNLIGSIF